MLTRFEFLVSLLGLQAGTRALARFDPAVARAKFIPAVRLPQFAAYEFLRLLIEQTAITTDSNARTWWVADRQANVSLPRLGNEDQTSIDELTSSYIVPMAEQMAAYLRDEQARGARGLHFQRLPLPAGNSVRASVVSDDESGYSCRYSSAHDIRRDSQVVRFDILYSWEKAPLRRKRPFLAFDPKRLPA